MSATNETKMSANNEPKLVNGYSVFYPKKECQSWRTENGGHCGHKDNLGGMVRGEYWCFWCFRSDDNDDSEYDESDDESDDE